MKKGSRLLSTTTNTQIESEVVGYTFNKKKHQSIYDLFMHETKSDLRNVAEVGGNQAFACIDFCP